MAGSKAWLFSEEQDFVDLCQKWKTGLGDPEVAAIFGWDQRAIRAALTGIDAFLSARTRCEGDDSRGNRQAKDEAREAARAVMRDFANSSIHSGGRHDTTKAKEAGAVRVPSRIGFHRGKTMEQE
jgi:hypothetical protein